MTYRFATLSPGALPFAMDGGANFYVFDLRREIASRELPVYFFRHATHDWGRDAIYVAASFAEACEGRAAPG